MDRYYGGVIWTNHILQRMKERGLTQSDVLWVFNHPEKTVAASDPGAYRFYRNHNNLRLEVIAKKNEEGKWIMMSCWSKPLYGAERLKFKNPWSLLWRIPLFIIKTILGK